MGPGKEKHNFLPNRNIFWKIQDEIKLNFKMKCVTSMKDFACALALVIDVEKAFLHRKKITLCKGCSLLH